MERLSSGPGKDVLRTYLIVLCVADCNQGCKDRQNVDDLAGGK